MKIYKNPWVSRESYFVKTSKATSGRMEASKSKGYSIDFWDGKWIVSEAQFYDQSLKDMPVIAEPKVSIKSIIDNAVLSAVLGYVEAKGGMKVAKHKDYEALLEQLEERQATLVKEWGPRDHYTRGFEEAVDMVRRFYTADSQCDG